MNIRRKFGTSDLPLAAYLKYKGCRIVELVKINDWKAEIIFEQVDNDLITEFNTDKATVEPNMFAGVMRQLTKSARSVTSQ